MLADYIQRNARKSGFFLFLLNWQLFRLVPFNAPHGFKILRLDEDEVTTVVPFKKVNLNHVRSLHACALATASEFTTGLALLQKLNGKKYRIILKELRMEYHFQGKTEAKGDFKVTQEWLDQYVLNPLKSSDSVVVPCTVLLFDTHGNKLSTGTVHWQIKPWEKVRTKI